jgi:uncharacterized protein (TIGR02466 family)
MLALCNKSLGNFDESRRLFEAALARAPNDPNLLGNHANLLYRLGRCAEAIGIYRRLLAATPGHADWWMNLGLALVDTGNAVDACDALQRAVALRPEHGASWQALAAALRNSGDLDGAEDALRNTVQLQSGNGSAWTALGVVKRLQGDPLDALTCYRKARAVKFSGPEIDDAEASARLDFGETAAALAMARKLVLDSPDYAPGHSLLAHILWEHGDAHSSVDDPAGSFRAVLADRPSNSAVRQEFIRFLLKADAADEALEQILILRSQNDAPAFVGMEANAREILGEHSAAAELFTQALAALPNDAGLLNLYVRHLLRTGKADTAAIRALEALRSEPHNQLSLAYLGLAWRLTGDKREAWLCGYENLVREVPVDTTGFTERAEYFSLLEATLNGMHNAKREPVDQSVRGGSQTSGRLFGRPEPVISALRDSIASAVSRYVSELPHDPTHPFLQRKSKGIRFAGSWSVRLASNGRHVNHFHQEGWISSAYYVALPPSVTEAAATDPAGFLQFGEPPRELGLALAPRRIIKPGVGRLVLFPSFLWHGTLPFHDDSPRLTVAFDAVPD